jgi:hypothetical protein
MITNQGKASFVNCVRRSWKIPIAAVSLIERDVRQDIPEARERRNRTEGSSSRALGVDMVMSDVLNEVFIEAGLYTTQSDKV